MTGRDQKLKLAQLLDRPLVVVDVGCRWGFSDLWTPFGDRCGLIGFDADAEECSRLAEAYGDGARFVPVALGAEAGTATLYKTKDPGGYSLLPPASDPPDNYPGLEGIRLVGTTSVEVTTLDQWSAGEGLGPVDVMKIDTQGSELDVLQGAEATLRTVRAIEVEVEFNELYEDVPLFADVDRYLRSQGFVLWRLRDLAHHLQHGAKATWHPERSYFDVAAPPVLAGGGQLFWANAFYLRHRVARPRRDAGWGELVRDACVTAALGFEDLTGLQVEAARRTAPPAVQAELADLAEHDGASTASSPSAAAAWSSLDTELTVDMSDAELVGWGWQPAQQVTETTVRWTGPGREAAIDLPTVLPPGSHIEIVAMCATSTDIIEKLELEVNRTPVPLECVPHAIGVSYTGELPADYRSVRRFTRVLLRTPYTVPWNELHPDSVDDIELGIAIESIRLLPPEAGPVPHVPSDHCAPESQHRSWHRPGLSRRPLGRSDGT